MKTLSHTIPSVKKADGSVQSPIRVCMNLRINAPVTSDVRVMREATTLVNEGYNVTIVDVVSDRHLPTEETIGDIYVKHMVKPRWLAPTHKLLKPLQSIEKAIVSALTLMRVPTDIYHAHDLNTLPACFLAAMIRRKPLIYDAHELPLNHLDHTRKRRLRALLVCFLTAVMARCAGVITVSPPIVQEIRKRYRTSNVTLIRNTPTYQKVPKNDRLRQHLGLGPQVRIALYQGNIQADRQLDNVVRAAAFLKTDIEIVLMGQVADITLSELEALARDEGVTDRIRFLPPVSYKELLEWTTSADIGLILYSPDRSSNVKMCLPNKLFEYLMAGLPVLASSLDAVEEILNTYDAGRIVPSLAPEDLADAINALLDDQDALERMRRNALNAAQQDLCWEQERSQLLRLYQDVLTAKT
jgi:glycosyltransferase involved in cell wall biosynthesis